MPVYEYSCSTCGPFEATRPIAEFDRPVPCPGCGTNAPRELLSVPFFATADSGRRDALASGASGSSRLTADTGHGASCSCCRPVRMGPGGTFLGR